MAPILMNKLSKRLNALISECKNADVWADIGCDHGYVTLSLILQNKANTVYATDIHAESLEKTITLLKNHNKQSKAEFFVGDGFLAIEQNKRNKINSCIIAGMGGQEIIKILKVFQPQHLVLQPMKNIIELREYLIKNYIIEKDYVLQDKNKFYNILTCTKGKSENITQQEIMFGKTNLKLLSNDFKNYLLSLKQKNEQILLKHSNEQTLNVLQNIENALNLFK